MDRDQITQLGLVFSKIFAERPTVSVKILKRFSKRKFIVADSSRHCYLESDDKHCLPDELVQEGKCITIRCPKIDQIKKTLEFDKESTVVEHGPIKGIKCEVCYCCNEVLYGDNELLNL